jgi:hypothetical protein
MVAMVKVKSSNLAEIGYDEREARLFVRFKDCARLYQYDPVPPIVWLGLRECQSKGSYLRTQVIPYFRCRQVAENEFRTKAVIQ